MFIHVITRVPSVCVFVHRGHSEVLIGLNDRAREGQYVYTDGTPFDYKPWSKHDPNRMPGDGDIVRIKKYNDEPGKKFADGDSRKSYVFVCKKVYGDKPQPILREFSATRSLAFRNQDRFAALEALGCILNLVKLR